MSQLNYLSFKTYFGAQKNHHNETVHQTQIYSDIFGKLHLHPKNVIVKKKFQFYHMKLGLGTSDKAP